MLINKPFTDGDIVSMKLVNGDEIIARFEDETPTTYKISRPLALTMSGGGLGMIPWMFLGESDTFTLKKEHVFTAVLSKKDAANQYTQGTTGIALS
jgi:hypothetical protein